MPRSGVPYCNLHSTAIVSSSAALMMADDQTSHFQPRTLLTLTVIKTERVYGYDTGYLITLEPLLNQAKTNYFNINTKHHPPIITLVD